MTESTIITNWKDLKMAIERMSETEQREPIIFQDLNSILSITHECKIKKCHFGSYLETCCELLDDTWKPVASYN